MAVWRFRSVVAAVLAALLLSGEVARAAKPPLDAATAKQRVQARGIGQSIKVVEVDGTHARGIISSIHNDVFEITPPGTAQPTVIPFDQVTTLQNDGGASKKGAFKTGVAIGAGVYLTALGLVVLITIVGAVASAH
jgi:hypothetical protein